MIQMNLFTKQKQTHRLRKNKLKVTKGGQGLIRSLGLADTHYYK